MRHSVVVCVLALICFINYAHGKRMMVRMGPEKDSIRLLRELKGLIENEHDLIGRQNSPKTNQNNLETLLRRFYVNRDRSNHLANQHRAEKSKRVLGTRKNVAKIIGNQHWVEKPKRLFSKDGPAFRRQLALDLDSAANSNNADTLMANVVGKHNYLRSVEAVTEGAAKMNKMYGDANLAAFAKALTDTCYFAHTSNSERSQKFGYTQIGENLAVTTNGQSTPEALIQNWYDEKPNYDFSSRTCANGTQCGHYTQVVWGDSTYVGCAVTRCSPLNFQGGYWSTGYFLACNYGEAGNYENQDPYVKSSLCASCSNVCQDGLCLVNAGTTTPSGNTENTGNTGYTSSPSYSSSGYTGGTGYTGYTSSPSYSSSGYTGGTGWYTGYTSSPSYSSSGYTGGTGYTGYTSSPSYSSSGYTGGTGYTGYTSSPSYSSSGYTGGNGYTGYTSSPSYSSSGYTGGNGYTGYTSSPSYTSSGYTGGTGYTGYTSSPSYSSSGYTGGNGYTGYTSSPSYSSSGYTGGNGYTGYTSSPSYSSSGYTGGNGYTGYTSSPSYSSSGYTGGNGYTGYTSSPSYSSSGYTGGYTGYTGSTTSSSSSSEENTDSGECSDVDADCAYYQSWLNICSPSSEYYQWASTDCKDTCGFCYAATSTTTPPPATSPSAQCSKADKKQNCDYYVQKYNICDGQSGYFNWAKKNCYNTCRFCECRDFVSDCSTSVNTHQVCTRRTNYYWYGKKYCKQTCNLC